MSKCRRCRISPALNFHKRIVPSAGNFTSFSVRNIPITQSQRRTTARSSCPDGEFCPPAQFSDISVSREDLPEEAMTDINGSVSAVRVENPFGDFEMPDYEFSRLPETVTEPADAAETVTAGTTPVARDFDIGDYMPDDIEFPDFGDIEFDTAPFN